MSFLWISSWTVLFVFISEVPLCELSSSAAEGIGAGPCRACRDQKSTMNESSSARAGESTWSSGQQMKMENCYHLWVPVQVHASGERRWGHDGCPVSSPLLIWSTKYLSPRCPHLPPSPSSTIHHCNRQTDVCRSPTSTENCPCAKLPLGWEILFICCTSPIMFLSPSRLWVLFIKIAEILTYFSEQKLNNNSKKKSYLPTYMHPQRPSKEQGYRNEKCNFVFGSKKHRKQSAAIWGGKRRCVWVAKVSRKCCGFDRMWRA